MKAFTQKNVSDSEPEPEVPDDFGKAYLDSLCFVSNILINQVYQIS